MKGDSRPNVDSEMGRLRVEGLGLSVDISLESASAAALFTFVTPQP